LTQLGGKLSGKVYCIKHVRDVNNLREKYKSVHLSREGFLPTPMAVGLRMHFPLKSVFNNKLQQMKEAGLVLKWLSGSPSVSHVG